MEGNFDIILSVDFAIKAKQDIEHIIELLLGECLSSKTSYKMPPTHLKELSK
ncbi:unnamed protein product [Spirodela intermedia]|uniref:Uncharacterized protein n=1 Tax=Spirodela intermedia TaxID=51605 RepID=A0A7I8JUC5_SPIIN|nr:unnamed protein product [Spirodela intermedia]CAA6673790.1 unnamed protein product [Spirodela intermedia]